MVKVLILKVNLMVIMMIFIYKGIFFPTIVVTMLRMFITRKQMLVAAMTIICQRWILRKIYLKTTEENNEPQTDDKQSSVKHTLSLISIDADEIFFVSTIFGKSILHEEKLALLDKKPCRPLKAILSKRKKKIGKRDQCCSKGLFHHKDGSICSWLTYSLDSDDLYGIPCLLLPKKLLPFLW